MTIFKKIWLTGLFRCFRFVRTQGRTRCERAQTPNRDISHVFFMLGHSKVMSNGCLLHWI